MKKSIMFIVIVVAAYIGCIIGAALNLEGYFGVGFAITVVGMFILACSYRSTQLQPNINNS